MAQIKISKDLQEQEPMLFWACFQFFDKMVEIGKWDPPYLPYTHYEVQGPKIPTDDTVLELSIKRPILPDSTWELELFVFGKRHNTFEGITKRVTFPANSSANNEFLLRADKIELTTQLEDAKRITEHTFNDIYLLTKQRGISNAKVRKYLETAYKKLPKFLRNADFLELKEH